MNLWPLDEGCSSHKGRRDFDLELIMQPEDGPSRLLSAFKNAKKSIEVAIFRFDRNDIEESLKAAVTGA